MQKEFFFYKTLIYIKLFLTNFNAKNAFLTNFNANNFHTNNF